MWPLIAAAAIPAVASAFGQHQANKQNVQLSREGMAFEADQAVKQMQFQERMSNTSYQRATEDMRLAGINPMLAYAQGGASTPGGGAASGSAATVQDVVGPAVVSAQHARRLSQELKLMKQETAGRFIENQDLKPKQGALLSAQIAQQKAQTALTRREMLESGARTKGHLVSAEVAAAGLPGVRATSARRRVFEPAYSWARGAADRLFSTSTGRAGGMARYELGRLGRKAMTPAPWEYEGPLGRRR